MENSQSEDDVFLQAGHVSVFEVADVISNEWTEVVAVESSRIKLLLKFSYKRAEISF